MFHSLSLSGPDTIDVSVLRNTRSIAWIDGGKEIESLVPSRALRRAVASVLLSRRIKVFISKNIEGPPGSFTRSEAVFITAKGVQGELKHMKEVNPESILPCLLGTTPIDKLVTAEVEEYFANEIFPYEKDMSDKPIEFLIYFDRYLRVCDKFDVSMPLPLTLGGNRKVADDRAAINTRTLLYRVVTQELEQFEVDLIKESGVIDKTLLKKYQVLI